MIYLWSATPGTGKTCYVVKQLIDNWLKDEKNKDRKVYANIAGLKIEGIDVPPDDFRDCQDGSLIIYDEAQDIRHYSSEVRDDPVARALSKHRHRGFDIHFITQDPALLNKWVLKNVFLHNYLWRPAQRDLIEIFTFARAIVSPTKDDFKNAFDKRMWRFEKQYLEYYKSTVVNTSHKITSLKRNSIIGLGILFFIIIAGLVSLPSFVSDDVTSDANTTTKSDSSSLDNTQKQSTSFIQSKDIEKTTSSQNLTQEQMQEQLKVQEQQFKLELEKQKLEMMMQYEQLHKQFAEQQKQMQDFYARLELYKSQLPKNYEIIKQDPNLQVRAVVKMGNKCNAYNTHGDLMTLTFDECDYYLKATGRVHRNPNAPVARLETKPVADILAENPNSHTRTHENALNLHENSNSVSSTANAF